MGWIDKDKVIKVIASMPSTETVAIKHGMWVRFNDRIDMYCSECSTALSSNLVKDFNYCPYCGSKNNKE